MISTDILAVMNKKARRDEAANVVLLREDPTVPYGPGKVITRQITSLNHETFTLVQRLEEQLSSTPDAKFRWIVAFKDKFGKVQNADIEFVRQITEVGTPSTMRHESIPGLDWSSKPETESITNDDGSIEEVVVVKGGRGRPEGVMNELKAKNIFRNTLNGKIEYDDKKLYEAFDFLVSIGQENDAEKYLEKIYNQIEFESLPL